jgi:hypothetical protein
MPGKLTPLQMLEMGQALVHFHASKEHGKRKRIGCNVLVTRSKRSNIIHRQPSSFIISRRPSRPRLLLH